MDKAKREELEKRRSEYQKELHLKKIRDRHSYIISFLETADYKYKVYYKSEFLNWLYLNVDIRKKDGYHGVHEDFQIDVQDSEAKESAHIKYSEISTNRFSKEILSFISRNDNFVHCQLGGDPDLETSVEAFLADLDKFLSVSGVWLVSTKKDWVIEYLSDQEVIRIIRLTGSKPILLKNIILENDD